MLDERCTICQCNISNNFITLECGHMFHKRCIFKWIEPAFLSPDCECPNCRTKINRFTLYMRMGLTTTKNIKKEGIKKKLETLFMDAVFLENSKKTDGITASLIALDSAKNYNWN